LFSETLDPKLKKNQEKMNLYQKIQRMTSPVQQENFTDSTWEQREGVADDVIFLRQ